MGFVLRGGIEQVMEGAEHARYALDSFRNRPVQQEQ